MKVVIPMTGLGKRFVEAGYVDPKPFLSVDGVPILRHVIDLFPGERDVLIICRPEMTARTKEICPYATIVEDEYRGLGPVDTVLKASYLISDDEEVIVSYCDYGTQWDYEGFKTYVRSQNASGAIACYRGFHPHNLGKDCYATVRVEDGIAQEIKEKGYFSSNKLDDYTSNGTYYFRTGALLKQYCALLDTKINGELYMSLVYNRMIQDGHKVVVFEIEKMLQWGTPYDLEVYKMWSGCFHSPPQTRIEAPGITLLPMAGQGSRFRMEGFTVPKPFLPISGNPMMVEAIRCLPKTPKLRIVCLQEHQDVQPYFPEASIIRLDKTTDGQATTCNIALDDISDNTPLTITACDNGAIYDANKLQALMEDESVDVIVWSFHNNPTSRLYPHMYAWLDVDENMNLRDVSIKKAFVDRPNIHAIIGTMFFRKTKYFRDGYKHIVKHNIRTNGEYYVDNVLKPLVDMGLRVVVFPVDYYLCWGTPNDYKTFIYWDSYFNHATHRSSH
jgi:NDP-sugar pyrophosphorylase family protein